MQNARPITTICHDKSDLDALTKNYFLLSRSNQSLPPGVFKKEDVYSENGGRLSILLETLGPRIPPTTARETEMVTAPT